MSFFQNQYVVDAKQLLATAQTEMDDKVGWTHVVTKEGTELSKKSRPDVCSFPAYLVKTVINKPKEEVVNKIWGVNEGLAKKNDPKLLSWTEVEKGDTWKVCSQYNATAWPAWTRHLVFSQVRIDNGNKTYLIAKSVDHPKAPTDTTQYVRAHLYMSVYEYSDNGNSTTTVRRITHIDPKGALPVWLVEAYAGNLVNMFNMWKHE